MSPSPLPFRFGGSDRSQGDYRARKAAEFESMARLLEEFIPKFKAESDQQFYRDVVDSYRAAARELVQPIRVHKCFPRGPTV